MTVLAIEMPAMTLARRQQISLEQTPYYHCTTRCVRRAFLCGKDRHTGRTFDHRKQWIEDRLISLSAVFAIDLVAYAIMSNHYHVVVRINVKAAAAWTDDEVIDRWGQLFKLPGHVSDEHVGRWRQRMADLSWFMRCLNEPLARASNREDGCTGRFWEGRFRCQALLDEEALVKCMVYVDLNPIRASVAESPETSAHTSVKTRIEGRDAHLVPMSRPETTAPDALPIGKDDYLELVDWTGRCVHPQKRGRIQDPLPPILERLNSSGKRWIDEMTHYGRWYYRAVGSLLNMQRYCHHLGQQWLKGQRQVSTQTQ